MNDNERSSQLQPLQWHTGPADAAHGEFTQLLVAGAVHAAGVHCAVVAALRQPKRGRQLEAPPQVLTRHTREPAHEAIYV